MNIDAFNAFQHRKLASGRWRKFSLIEQLANIGSEVERTIKWKPKNLQYGQKAFERVLELFDLTLKDPKNRERLKEIARGRELFVDFYFDNIYRSTTESWRKYFYAFNYYARLGL